MNLSLKELLAVLALAAVVFRLTRPMAIRFISAADLSRRRNVGLR